MMKHASVLMSLLLLAGATVQSAEAAAARAVVRYRVRVPRVTSLGTGPMERLRSGGRLDPDEYRISNARISDAKYLPGDAKRLRRELRLEKESLRGSERTGRSSIVSSYRGQMGRTEIKKRKKKRSLLF